MATLTPYCHGCNTFKEKIGLNRYRCKCVPEQQPSHLSLACQSNNSIQTRMVVPRNGVVTQYEHKIGQGVQILSYEQMKDGRVVVSGEIKCVSYD
ncbi:hypothetical protein F2P79_024767 [Pimephales promelas]|nr:hypothetical protein F2P79_024767 [Pimephales promelas]